MIGEKREEKEGGREVTVVAETGETADSPDKAFTHPSIVTSIQLTIQEVGRKTSFVIFSWIT